MKDDLIYQIALSKIPYVGTVMAKKLVEVCGDVKSIFLASKRTLLKVPRLNDKIAEAILAANPEKLSEDALKYIVQNNIKVLFCTDTDYPNRLKYLSDSPMILYSKGNIDLNASRIVAIVGTRQPTEYGEKMCEELVKGLAEYNVTIISGLAYGIDVVAHQKCISLQSPTIGVLGHGFQHMYPAKHKKVAAEMLKNGGLLTQFEPHQIPIREHFPMRNKIIAGLADAVIVVETSKKGGSMITAEMANAYNKDVFAVPGRLNDKNSLGCNFLIKTNKAKLIDSAADIANMMHWGKTNVKTNQQASLFFNYNPEEQKIMDCLRTKSTLHIDELIYQTGLRNSQVAASLLSLEFNGIVKALPGKMFTIC